MDILDLAYIDGIFLWASISPDIMSKIFNQLAKQLQMSRFTLLNPKPDYIYTEIAARICDRLYDIKHDFNEILSIGPCIPTVEEDKCKRTTHVQDSSLIVSQNGQYDVIIDTSLHYQNDLISTLEKYKSLLTDEGCFISVVPGPDTLYELRSSIQQTQQALVGGIKPHIHPTLTVQDTASLLSQTGFSLVTIDLDDIIVEYPSMFELIGDLNAMGQGNALSTCGYIGQDVLIGAAATYQSVYGSSDKIPATFSFIFMVTLL